MYVISVKGSKKGSLGFWYLCGAVGDNNVFTDKESLALEFKTAKDAINYAKTNYIMILTGMIKTNARLYSDTLAVRKITYKTIKLIDQNIIGDNNGERNNALDAVSDNGSESESGLEEEMSDNVVQTSSSDLQENTAE